MRCSPERGPLVGAALTWCCACVQEEDDESVVASDEDDEDGSSGSDEDEEEGMDWDELEEQAARCATPRRPGPSTIPGPVQWQQAATGRL